MSANNHMHPISLFVKATFLVALCMQPSCAKRDVRDATRTIQMISAEQEAKWNGARKLGLRKDLDEKQVPYPFLDGTDPDRLEVDDIAKMDNCAFEVSLVVDDENCLLSLGSREYWLTSYPTVELRNGMSVRLVDPVRILPNRDYKSVGRSTKNVRCLKMIPPDEAFKWEEEEKRRRLEEMKKSREPIPANGIGS